MMCSFIKVELLDVCGKNYGLTINNLYAAIYPEKCTVKVRDNYCGVTGIMGVGRLTGGRGDFKIWTPRKHSP